MKNNTLLVKELIFFLISFYRPYENVRNGKSGGTNRKGISPDGMIWCNGGMI